MHKRHTVATAKIVIGFEPFKNGPRLHRRVLEALGVRDFNQLPRGKPGFVFNGVKVGLEGHQCCLSLFLSWTDLIIGDST
ncbi:hypothetical protein D3C73_1244630 [compost metagenome]